MGVVLGRTALSPNIKERRDYSCAVFDAAGGSCAQAAHIPSTSARRRSPCARRSRTRRWRPATSSS
jgi:N-methylhydantoinase B